MPVVSSRVARSLCLLVATVSVVLGSTSCGSPPRGVSGSGLGGSSAGHGPPVVTSPGAGAGNDNPACRLLNAAVIDAADFPVPVSRIPAESKANVSPGLSICTYGDEPDPKLLSLNELSLLRLTPQALRLHHQSAREAVTQDSANYVSGTIRQRGPSDGIGSFSFFCIGKPGSVRGGWIQNGNAYLLNLNSLTRADRTSGQRLERYEATARVISAHVPG
jgi:hypothetical protein